MDILIKQMRGRLSGAGQGDMGELSSNSDKRIPPQKTVSFKGEKKRTQSWLRRQSSGKMIQDYDSNNNIEHAISVAAAAYAINKAEESNQKQTSKGPEPSLTKPKSRKNIKLTMQEIGGVSNRHSGEISMKPFERSDSKVPITDAKQEKKPENGTSPAPPINKIPSGPNKQSNNTGSLKPQKSASKSDLPTLKPGSLAPKPKPPTTKQGSGVPTSIRPAFQPIEAKRQHGAQLGTQETKANEWEKAQMAKINERHEKLRNTILSWESKKKSKARRKLEIAEKSEIERTRKKGLEKFRQDMEYIEQIAGGARAKEEESRRNEELKAKEKASKIRTTGKVPSQCFCF